MRKETTSAKSVATIAPRQRLATAIQKHSGLLAQKKGLEERRQQLYDRMDDFGSEIEKARKVLGKSEERDLQRLINPKLSAPKVSVDCARAAVADLEREDSAISNALGPVEIHRELMTAAHT